MVRHPFCELLYVIYKGLSLIYYQTGYQSAHNALINAILNSALGLIKGIITDSKVSPPIPKLLTGGLDFKLPKKKHNVICSIIFYAQHCIRYMFLFFYSNIMYRIL